MASKARSSVKRQVVLLKFSVKSEHPNIDTLMLLQQMDAAQPKLQAKLASHAPIQDVSIERRGNLPIGLETAVVSILVNVGTGLAKDALKDLATEAFAWMKKRWKDASFRRMPTTKAAKATRAKRRKRKLPGK